MLKDTRLRKIMIRCIICLLLITISFSGCGEADSGQAAIPSGPGGNSSEQASADSDDEAEPEDSFKPYEAPKFKTSKFDEEKAEGDSQSKIDLSSIKSGYVGVSVRSDKRIKFQVLMEDNTYNYDVASDGTPAIFPLQCGSGTYQFRVMENIKDNQYACIYQTSRDVELKDKYQPFLRPSNYVNYSKKSECVKKAKELAETQEDALGVVSAIFDYICKTVKYDEKFAANVQSGYLPTPDETMKTGKGICIDYAALAAAMMRSQGIPTKMVFGYVSPNDIYHAWNMFYTEETGWVTVSYEVKGGKWNRMDVTFSANGADSEFIGNGENYADVYYY